MVKTAVFGDERLLAAGLRRCVIKKDRDEQNLWMGVVYSQINMTRVLAT